ncbi:hypothetical protein [Companilactobacillus furfuricola]|uniref:hypothetical protein n=1 Tax=Companilactobacillus furfuricola TaxID=1462575 RepID=UPI000F799C9B|nr:hypothetical protein [Companilactobacillus furfuricola]
MAQNVLNSINTVTYDENHPVQLNSDTLQGNLGSDLSAESFADLLSNTDAGKLKVFNPDQVALIKAAGDYKYVLSYQEGNQNDLKVAFDAFAQGDGATIKLNVQTKDKDGKTVGNHVITFVNNTKDIAGATNLNIHFNTPIKVALNSETTPIKKSESAKTNTTVDNNNGQTVAYQSIVPGGFYSNPTDAKDFKNPLDLGNHFKQAGKTYYQPVTINFDKDKTDIWTITDNSLKSSDTTFTLNGNSVLWENVNWNGNTNAVTYVREIVVGDKEAEKPDTTDPDGTKDPDKNDQKDPDTNKDPDPEDEVGVWKETDQDGIITVNNQIANLMNDDNVLTTRSLAANTQWVTDKYRENSATGAIQYRVSTHEWVNASDVTFQEKIPNFFTNITQYPEFHTVTLAGPSGFVYALFNKDGVRSLRGLAGRTTWATDQRATDANGNIYYRVSTDEWIQEGAGVTVD